MNTCVKVRVFRREEVLSEITEADRVTHLECLDATRRGAAVEGEGVVGTKWAYGLANGELLRENAAQISGPVWCGRKGKMRDGKAETRRDVLLVVSQYRLSFIWSSVCARPGGKCPMRAPGLTEL